MHCLPQRGARVPLAFAVLLGLSTAVAVMVCIASSALAADPIDRFVSPDGNDDGDCSILAHPCQTIQYAVDVASEGDLIKVAAGVYSDVHSYPPPAGYPDPPGSGLIQVVYLEKPLTVQGGYSTADGYAEPPDPDWHPTTLDAQEQGRVLCIAASDVSVRGLRLTGGTASGLGGHPYALSDAGGGIYLFRADHATVAVNEVFGNSAASGGGIYAYDSDDLLVSGNRIAENAAGLAYYDMYGGGGLYLNSSSGQIAGNTISDNRAETAHGGGLYFRQSTVTLDENMVSGNQSNWSGGGIYAHGGTLTLVRNWILENETLSAHGQGGGVFLTYGEGSMIANLVSGNAARGAMGPSDGGGGLYLSFSHASLTGNLLTSNSSANSGAGLVLRYATASLVNNVIADNQVAGVGKGAGVYVYRSVPSMIHNTLARNHGGDGSGLYAGGLGVRVTMTNTVVVSHSVGITAAAGAHVSLNATLWYGNSLGDTGGEGTVDLGDQNLHAHPRFDADGHHLSGASPAIGQGLWAGVTTDVDSQIRRTPPDIGADEYWLPVYLPLVEAALD